MTSKIERIRSLLLVALMVGSVVAVSGTAAAGLSDSSRSVSDSAVSPGGEVQVTTTVNVDSNGGGVSVSETFSPNVQDATVDSVEVNGESAETVVAAGDSTGVVATLQDDAPANATVEVTYTITTEDTENQSYEIDGTVNGGGDEVSTGTTTIETTAADDGEEDDGDESQVDDETLNSGSSYFAGQTVTASVPQANTDYRVRTVDDDGDIQSLQRTITSSADGTLEFDLDGQLSGGDYVVVNPDGQPIAFSDGVGSVGSGDASDEQFEVVIQDLSAEFDENSVGTTGDSAEVDFEIDSEVRNGYAVNVSADGLDRDDLEDIFAGSGAELASEDELVDVENPSEFFDDTEKVQIQADAEAEYTLNFSEIDEGNYTFETEVTDTDASDSDSIDVVDTGDAESSFEDSISSEERGDVAELTVQLENTDEATVQIGDEDDDNYYAVAEVTDDNDDGEVTLAFNSLLAGNAPADEVVTVVNDDDTIDAVEQSGSFVGSDELLDATDYDMLTTEGTIGLSSNASAQIENEDDVGTLSLAERSTENLQTWTAPSDTFSDIEDLDDDDAGSVYDLVNSDEITQTDEVAIDDVSDVVIVQVEASGLEGAVYGTEIDTSGYESLSDEDEGPFSLEFEDANPGANVDDDELGTDVGALDDVKVVYDEANDTHFVAIKASEFTSNDQFNAEDEDEFTANFSVYDRDDGLSLANDDETESVTDSFEFVEADATLDDSVGSLSASASQEVSGQTNVAPGTEVTVRLRSSSSGSPFLLQPDATVQPDGTFSTTADLSERSPGANYTAQTRVDGVDVGDDVEGTIVEGETASVSISDQESTGDTVTVDSANLANGGFIAIHNGSAGGEVVGSSDYLEAGSHSDIEITLDSTQSEDFTAVAMPHFDTDGDEEYEFNASADDGVDAPYTDADGPVTDSASVTIVEETTTTEEPTTEEVMTTEEPATDDTATETPTEGDGPGFTAVIALVALVAAALLAVRRNNN